MGNADNGQSAVPLALPFQIDGAVFRDQIVGIPARRRDNGVGIQMGNDPGDGVVLCRGKEKPALSMGLTVVMATSISSMNSSIRRPGRWK
ncbi:MAG TPA: hypothetical protein PKO04_04815 [Smithellaceae bacterium]|jgi:hypothetical protein|nr:hypothetical protein [Smithellaceae bacterium]